jgi:hypothetical protein
MKSLEKTGLIENLKSQIRSNLISQFNGNPENFNKATDKSIINKLSLSEDSIIVKSLKISSSLIREMLKIYNLQHTLSVFLLEIGMKDFDYFDDFQLKSFLSSLKINISDETTIQNSIHPFLIQLIQHLILLSMKTYVSCEVQTCKFIFVYISYIICICKCIFVKYLSSKHYSNQSNQVNRRKT